MQELEKILEEIDEEIERERAICKDIKDTPGWRLYEKIMKRVKDIIRKHMNDGWIPVEERMPDPEEDVGVLIVTERNGNVWGDIYYGYANETDEKPCFHKWDDEMWRCFKPDVIAWRPLPKPYRPGKE